MRALAPNTPEFQRAAQLYSQGDLPGAEALCQEVVRTVPMHWDALHLLGVLAIQRNDTDAGIHLIQQSLAVAPQQPEACINLGNALSQLGRDCEALACYDRALKLQPLHAVAWNHKGRICVRLERFEEAAASFERALELRPDYVAALNNYASALIELRRSEEALEVLGRALGLRRDYPEGLCNKGMALLGLQRFDEALACFDRTLALQPAIADAYSGRGKILAALRRPDEALTEFQRALQLQPGLPHALQGSANALQKLKRFPEAAQAFTKLIEVAPTYPYVLGTLHHLHLRTANWSTGQNGVAATIAAVDAGLRAAQPFAFLAFTDSAAAQLQCARTYVAHKYPEILPRPSPRRFPPERIRVAYLSGDFREHAVSFLIAGLIEKHDRQRFETIGLSLLPPEDSALGKRVTEAFETFVDVSELTDHGVTEVMRQLEVDIAVDLSGFTGESRTGLLARHPAPIQVNYLGYPGTMGAGYMDYIIGDRFVIPESHRQHYAEQVVHLPDTFQANDDRREIADRPSRAQAGLPERGFVFCAFNNSYKITPVFFDMWMRLLNAVPESVLWLVTDLPLVRTHLHAEATRRGVDPKRLVFAEPIAYAQHLARFQLADLFLDTLPFNAGTTASDALWAGVPIVTCTGEAFAARMAGSLLHAVGLPELVTYSVKEYEALALELASHPARLNAVRERLAHNRRTQPLFDTSRFCRHLEAAFVTMWERHMRKEPPQGFAVAPIDR